MAQISLEKPMLFGKDAKEDIARLETNIAQAYEAIEHGINHLDAENFVEKPITRAEFEELKKQVEMLLNK